MNKKEKIEQRIARSKARIEARNLLKQTRRELQGTKMVISKEEIENREKNGKAPITSKKWKEVKAEELRKAREITAKSKNKPQEFYCEELKERRKAKRMRLKELANKKAKTLKQQSTVCSEKDTSVKQSKGQANFAAFILKMKQAKKISAKQSKEDKAKHKASLKKFKSTYVRTYQIGNTKNPAKGTGIHKRNMERPKYILPAEQIKNAA